MSMWARSDGVTQRLLHWSTVPFTVPCKLGESDHEFPDGTLLPADAAFVLVINGALVVNVVARTVAQWAALRLERTARLAACDWTQQPDVPATVDRAAWAAYRQALRDLPQRAGDPATVVWPRPPGSA